MKHQIVEILSRLIWPKFPTASVPSGVQEGDTWFDQTLQKFRGRKSASTVSFQDKIIETFAVTTDGSGVATVNISSAGFTSAPRVGTTCLVAGATAATGAFAVLTSVSATSVGIKTLKGNSGVFALLAGLADAPSVTVQLICVGS